MNILPSNHIHSRWVLYLVISHIVLDGFVGTLVGWISGAIVLDGFMEFFFKLHERGKSYGGNYDLSDMLVVAEDPLHVTITLEDLRENRHKDLS
jgi:hypothetical protein